MRANVSVSQFTLVVVFLAQASGQGVEPRQKASADRLNQDGIEQYKSALYENALSTFTSALAIYQVSGDTKGEATALSEIAMCLDGLGQKHRALDYLEKAVPKWRHVPDADNEASTLGKEGDIYRSWGFPDQALRYYSRPSPYS